MLDQSEWRVANSNMQGSVQEDRQGSMQQSDQGAALSRRERRIANSKILVRYVTPFAMGWYIIATILKAPRLEVAAAIATIGFLAGIALHWRGLHTTARVTWLLSANVAIFLASLVVHPSGYMSFILLAAAGMPFLIFSTRRNLPLIIFLVLLPVFLWFFAWWTEYTLLQPFDISEAEARSIIAPGSAITVFGVVLFEIAYFVLVSSRYAYDLSHERRRAEIANEAKSALLMSMSHEMRTPLNAITGFSELIREELTIDDSKQSRDIRERMDIILSASNDLLSMVENALAFASVAGTNIHADMQTVDVADAIENVVRRHGHLLSMKDLTLEVQVPNGIEVEADPALLFDALSQLLDNAVKYTPSGGRITVRAERTGAAQTRIVFMDTGPGFPQGDADRAFDAFERLDFANGTQSGAGIGLALVAAYVGAMGGKVGISNDLDEGGVVCMTLKAAETPVVVLRGAHAAAAS